MHHFAAHIGSTLALHRLGEEIADARELNSFNRLSTFLLHDLKNLVAQQSLVLENAKRFSSNPAFVGDALDAFEDSTSRMRRLIGRLRSQELGAGGEDSCCDLLALLRELLATPRLTLHDGLSVELVAPSGVAACHTAAERDTISQVFSHLLANAVESLEGDAGEVKVVVGRAASGWRAEVRDNGKGIPAAFVRDHLFRPFRTTKGAGLGIGLYQCKTIVEAIGGAIEVHSSEGRGTTVAVTLPARTLSQQNAA